VSGKFLDSRANPEDRQREAGGRTGQKGNDPPENRAGWSGSRDGCGTLPAVGRRAPPKNLRLPPGSLSV